MILKTVEKRLLKDMQFRLNLRTRLHNSREFFNEENIFPKSGFIGIQCWIF